MTPLLWSFKQIILLYFQSGFSVLSYNIESPFFITCKTHLYRLRCHQSPSCVWKGTKQNLVSYTVLSFLCIGFLILISFYFVFHWYIYQWQHISRHPTRTLHDHIPTCTWFFPANKDLVWPELHPIYICPFKTGDRSSCDRLKQT